jgi:hypothetical protein
MEILHFTPEYQLVKQLQDTTMLTNKSVHPYENADIRIEEMPIDGFSPTQLYVLKEHLEVQKDLRESFLDKGYDTLRLYGAVLLKNAGITAWMMPPIVEDDQEYGPCLLDGAHRAYLARQLGIRSIGVLHISGILTNTPMIALPTRWDEVIEYESEPTDKSKKKHYRNIPNMYNYYRDFSGITGIGKDPRSALMEG